MELYQYVLIRQLSLQHTGYTYTLMTEYVRCGLRVEFVIYTTKPEATHSPLSGTQRALINTVKPSLSLKKPHKPSWQKQCMNNQSNE